MTAAAAVEVRIAMVRTSPIDSGAGVGPRPRHDVGFSLLDRGRFVFRKFARREGMDSLWAGGAPLRAALVVQSVIEVVAIPSQTIRLVQGQANPTPYGSVETTGELPGIIGVAPREGIQEINASTAGVDGCLDPAGRGITRLRDPALRVGAHAELEVAYGINAAILKADLLALVERLELGILALADLG